ncbi:MAG: methyltransferase domain-containing protein [Rhodospirillaceae bacterium]
MISPMWIDIIDLREFYASPMGRAVRRLVGQRLRALWPAQSAPAPGQRLLGLGFVTPYLNLFEGEASHIVAAMPAGQGVMSWPEPAANRVALTDEQALPFPDRTFDRLILVHCVEGCPELRAMMRECWRVLADGGRLIVVVANRRSLWSRAEASPFAQGRPYSMSQITRLLRENMFVPLQTATALFAPPVGWRMFGRFAYSLEKLGARWFPTFGGALVIEAEKQLYAPLNAAPAVSGAHMPAKVAVKAAGNVRRA